MTLIVKYPEFEEEKACEDDKLTFIKVLKNVKHVYSDISVVFV